MLTSLVHADPGDHVGVHDPCCCRLKRARKLLLLVSMIADSQLRMREIEGFCGNLSPSPPPTPPLPPFPQPPTHPPASQRKSLDRKPFFLTSQVWESDKPLETGLGILSLMYSQAGDALTGQREAARTLRCTASLAMLFAWLRQSKQSLTCDSFHS